MKRVLFLCVAMVAGGFFALSGLIFAIYAFADHAGEGVRVIKLESLDQSRIYHYCGELLTSEKCLVIIEDGVGAVYVVETPGLFMTGNSLFVKAVRDSSGYIRLRGLDCAPIAERRFPD